MVDVSEEAGGPAEGVGVIGCGGAGDDTPADGQAAFMVLAEMPPCMLNIFRYDPSSGVYSVVFHRVGTLAENEQRKINVRLTDLDIEDGYTFDPTEYLERADGESWLPRRRPEPTPTEIADRERESRAFYAKWIPALERAREAVPAAAPQIDKELEESRIRESYLLDRMEAEEPVAEPVP